MNNAALLRSEMVDFLRRELIGPDPRPEHAHLNMGEEILRPQDPPRFRYSAGVLFPDKARVGAQSDATPTEIESAKDGRLENDDELAEVTPDGDSEALDRPGKKEGQEDASSGRGRLDSDDSIEYEVNRANEFLPSAMGLTALIRLPKQLRITVKAGRYEQKAQPNLGKQDPKGKWQPHHWRKAVAPEPVEIDCSILNASQPLTKEFPLMVGSPSLKLSLHIYSRPYIHAEDTARDRMVTFTLINRTQMSGGSPKNSECFFQCEFIVEDTAGGACFLEYPERKGWEKEEEEQSLRLLYRHRKTFAIGHGCAAWWPDMEDAATAVGKIKTDTLPAYEIKPIVPHKIDGLELSMLKLSSNDASTVVPICTRLAEEYKKWIDKQIAIVQTTDFPKEHQPAALKHLGICRQCHRRIVDGIELLKTDTDTQLAFAWMNQAMLEQQLHYDLAANHRRTWTAKAGLLLLAAPYAAPDTSHPPKGRGLWRPFQLAFILMNLRSIAQRECPERTLVDLIWFPTGGGKTEAYLGLTAFTIFRRRLFDKNDAGTTVLMRYTLRLLTTQQFQRAASLICACELIRRKNEARLGAIRISIGLWVGGKVTPNKNTDAVSALNTLLKEGKPNPFVVLTCPWCGVEMGAVRLGNSYQGKGYHKNGNQVAFQCEDRNCEFHEARGLPLLVVDEAIYEERPTLLIGTVDKFAQLPWNPNARRLFGLDNLKPVSPPDLIIQDELHLISGALGSMVGMYEGTIDALCRRAGKGQPVSAKIIASTATICRAGEQVHSLYARKAFLFPPQGLRAGDSFFAKEDQKGEGRLYVGVFGSALPSHVTAQVRVMAALLQAAKSVPASSPEARDPYWTLMAYFNNLRALGHAATLIRADIREYLNAVWDRLSLGKRAKDLDAPDLRRFINRDLELTSRIQNSSVTNILQQLFNSYPGTDECRPVDVCLATNMIQVGLDVPRLGLMTVMGQPKTTSEYIQATSRVGRDAKGPGLVVMVFSPGKPRDRSHFEHFRSYHQSIYRWVEPASITPFAVPVRERALHAQLITLVRYWDKTLRERPKPPPNDQLFHQIRDILIERIKLVDAGESAAAEGMLTELMAQWRRIQPAIYGQFGSPPGDTPLMYPSGTEPSAFWASCSKATPASMRSVDADCDARVISQF